MFRHLLVPLDGTPTVERSIPVAACLARAAQGSLILLRVIDWPPPNMVYDGGALFDPSASLSEQEVASATRYLNEAVQSHAQILDQLPVEQEIAFGSPAPTVFATACLERVDLIVLCSHTASRLRRWIIGSMARRAARKSPRSLPEGAGPSPPCGAGSGACSRVEMAGLPGAWGASRSHGQRSASARAGPAPGGSQPRTGPLTAGRAGREPPAGAAR